MTQIDESNVHVVMLMVATCVRMELVSMIDGNHAVESVLMRADNGISHEDAHIWELMLAGGFRREWV